MACFAVAPTTVCAFLSMGRTYEARKRVHLLYINQNKSEFCGNPCVKRQSLTLAFPVSSDSLVTVDCRPSRGMRPSLPDQNFTTSRYMDQTSMGRSPVIIASLSVFLALLVEIGMVVPSCSAMATGVESTFENTCAGCHAGGGNIVRRDATLQKEDLIKYGIGTPEALYDIIYSGKGSMPGYGQDCTPKGKCTFGKRLSDDEVKDLVQYVLNKAENGW